MEVCFPRFSTVGCEGTPVTSDTLERPPTPPPAIKGRGGGVERALLTHELPLHSTFALCSLSSPLPFGSQPSLSFCDSFARRGSSTPSSVRSLQALGLAIEATRKGPSHFLCILPCCLLFEMRQRMRSPPLISRGLTFLLPPSGFLLVFAKVDYRLCFDSFDCVDCWLDVFVRCFGSVGSMSKFFWCHCPFTIEELERCEFCGP